MSAADDTLDAKLDVAHERRVVSAHRTPDLLFEYAESAAARGLEVLIAGAGGAAHLPGMTAAKTLLPVLGVPMPSRALNGIDSLLSIVQMPAGVPVATFAIGALVRPTLRCSPPRCWRRVTPQIAQALQHARDSTDRGCSVQARSKRTRCVHDDHWHSRRRPARSDARAGRLSARL
jgi:5-(carboxyamino)imidazole ribonucleotide mutase